MRPTLPSLAVCTAMLLGGCGSSEEAAPTAGRSPAADRADATEPPPAAPAYTRAQIIAALGVTRGRDANGVPNSDLRIGCFASKIFVSPSDNMAAYQEIGDPVATNRHGNVGVVVGTYAGASESRCLRVFRERLARLK